MSVLKTFINCSLGRSFYKSKVFKDSKDSKDSKYLNVKDKMFEYELFKKDLYKRYVYFKRNMWQWS